MCVRRFPYSTVWSFGSPRLWPQEHTRDWCLAIAFAFLLTAMLATLLSAPALAQDAVSSDLRVRVSLPYWETRVNGKVMDLATADLDGDGKLEILVGQDTEGHLGELAVLRADGTLIVQQLTDSPVSRVRIVGFDENQSKRPDQADVIIAKVGWILGVNSSNVLAAIGELATGNPEPGWWPDGVDATAPVLGPLVLDVDGDKSPEVLVVIGGSAYALGLNFTEKWKFHEAQDITALAAMEGKVFLGTSQGDLYEQPCDTASSDAFCSGSARLVPQEVCIDTAITSLDVAHVGGDGSATLVAACNRQIFEVDLAGHNSPPVRWDRPVAQALGVALSEVMTPVTLVKDAMGVSILLAGERGAIGFDTGGLPAVCAVGDVNGDRVNEVVLAVGRSVRLYRFDNLEPEFGVRWVFSSPYADEKLIAFAEGDVDSDTTKELALFSDKGDVYAGGELQQSRVLDVISRTIRALRIADLDNDNFANDIVIGSEDGLYVKPALSELAPITYPTDSPVTAIIVDDVTGDSRPEILVSTAIGEISAYSLSKTGENTELTELWSSAVEGIALDIPPITADVDGDAHPEVVAVTMGKGATGWKLQILNGRSGQPWMQPIPIGGCKTLSKLASAPMDKDNRAEIVLGVADGTINIVHVGEQVADTEIVTLPKAVNSIRDLIIAELNGQLPLPEIAVHTSDTTLEIFGYDTDNKLAPIYKRVFASRITKIGTVDLDSDRLSQIVVTTEDGKAYILGLTLRSISYLLEDIISPREIFHRCE